MKFTSDQALRKGIDAHKAGKVQEADRYYTAILKANPKHPDANHNMGVLAVGVGKIQEALPLFKTALEVNPSIAQYWLSYIDALIKLDQIADAKAVFDQAKSNGAKGDAFDQIENQFGSYPAINSNTQEPAQEQLQNLINLYVQGQYQTAQIQASQLLKKFPNSVTLYNIIGATDKELGKLDEAIEAYDKAISIKPDYAEAYNNMGVAFKAKRKLAEAVKAYNKAISIKPDYAEAYYNMGITLQDQDKLEKAIKAYNEALSIKPDYAEAYNNMGSALKDKGKPEEAIKAYNKAISIKPDYAEAYNNMGIALQDQDKLEEAIETYNKAISIKPDFTEAYSNMGNALKDQDRLEEAIEVYNKALSIKPDYAEAYNNIGATLRDRGKLEEALEAYKKALSLKPNYAVAYNNMGNTLQEQGKLDKAIKAYTKALSLKPDFSEAHRNLSRIKKYTIEDKQFLQVQELYKRQDLRDDVRCHLNFALAKMYEDIGKLNQAFSHLSEGNALRKKLLNYSINHDQVLFTKLKNVQPNLLKNKLEIHETSSEVSLIFILGMLRSGTTLVEQIISSHSKVTGAGELNYVSQFGGHLAVDPARINTFAVAEFRKRYLSKVSKLSNDKPFVTDKMPTNFRFVPLICAAFPEAKIIHVQRNAAATCWSNYKHYFVSDRLRYCYDLKDVISYFNLYKDLMKFWELHYDDRIYHLNYEHLTTDQEHQTRRLIEHLELDWEETCLSPHQNKRNVRTASQQQVKKKVYRGSSEAWRKYEPYLNGVFDNIKSN